MEPKIGVVILWQRGLKKGLLLWWLNESVGKRIHNPSDHHLRPWKHADTILGIKTRCFTVEKIFKPRYLFCFSLYLHHFFYKPSKHSSSLRICVNIDNWSSGYWDILIFLRGPTRSHNRRKYLKLQNFHSIRIFTLWNDTLMRICCEWMKQFCADVFE